MTLSSPLTDVKGVGEELAKKFKLLGIESVEHLIQNYPRRYDDYSNVAAINKIKPGAVSVKAVIKQVKGRYARRGMHVTEALASDETGSVRLVWFNQPYREASLKSGAEYYISGQFELSRQRLAIMNPSVELVSELPVNTARILPVYRETKGLTSKQIRRLMRELLPLIRRLEEALPPETVSGAKLLGYSAAVESIHFPKSSEDIELAKYRLGFEEVFQLAMASLLNKRENQREKSVAIKFNERLAKNFVANLPFKLTDEQRKVIWQIFLDLQKPEPMNRLVEGDVGSGKTVVAAMAALMAIKQGFQVAFMAPTDILARQHGETIYKLLEPLGLHEGVALLTGSQKPSVKDRTRQDVKSGRAKFIIGTHALIQEKIDMHNLALVIIDEQHRFGVEQRKTLMSKAGHMPHVLSLTATPIPRSLALTLYGELDISVLGAKPAGRQKIITKLVSPNSKAVVYKNVKAELDSGRQMFVVCPLISRSDSNSVNSAESVYEQFSRNDFKKYKLGLLHGRLKAEDKNHIMEQYLDKELDILVSTTVIEVGVDVPNASVMMIMSAECFGLAQIHQLRGRVGRGGHKGFCYLMLDDSTTPTRRLRALESTDDGFRLAELDLELRGPGAIYGQAQHGALDLRIANLTDVKLISAARKAAADFLDSDDKLAHYKILANQVQKLRAVTNLN